MKTSVMYEKLKAGSKSLSLALVLLMLAAVGYAQSGNAADNQRDETWDARMDSAQSTNSADTQADASPSGTQNPKLLTAHPDWVQIPGALIRPDCVHEVPKGAEVVISGDKVTGDVTLGGVVVAHYDPCPEAPVITRPQGHSNGNPVRAPGTGNGWVAALLEKYTLGDGDNIDLLGGNWTVPSNPTASGGLVYLFNGIVSSDENWILQPVLQWGYNGHFGGNYWVFAGWLVGSDGSAYYSTPMTASPGDKLLGATALSGVSGSTLYWFVGAYKLGNPIYLTYLKTQSSGLQWNWAFPGVLEAYYINSCSQLPPKGGTWFTNTQADHGYPSKLRLPAGWLGASGSYFGWTGPNCGFSATPTSDGGVLTY